MPTQVFTSSDDTFTVSTDGDYKLAFLAGNDTLTVDGGTTTFATMDEGDDQVRLLSGMATVDGGSGNDRFDIKATGATAIGGSGDDLFVLRAGSDQNIAGDDGNDRINFAAGITNLTADLGSGDDAVVGYGFAVTGNIVGGDGNDSFVDIDGSGGLNIYGGTGNDTYRVSGTSHGFTIVENSGEGNDTVQLARGMDYTLDANVENIIVGNYAGSTDAAVTLTGNDLDNSIAGSANAETIYGLGGNDHIYGYGGDDALWGGEGNDLLDGGAGNDTLQGGTGNDILVGRSGADTMVGGTGNDTYYVDDVHDVVTENAGEGTDTLRTTVSLTLGANVENGVIDGSTGLRLYGNELDNRLWGNAGDDILRGYDGNDTINGGGGNDNIWGGNGADTLTGGSGNDHFVYLSVDESTPTSYDTITDWTPDLSGTGDVIDLTHIDANTSVDGDQAFTWTASTTAAANSLWYSQVDNGDGTYEVVLYGDVNGDTTADFELHVHLIGDANVGTDLLL